MNSVHTDPAVAFQAPLSWRVIAGFKLSLFSMIQTLASDMQIELLFEVCPQEAYSSKPSA